MLNRMRKADIMNTVTRSNILVRAARRVYAIGSEINYAQHRMTEIMTNPTGK
jgi:hypothetical protein